MPAHPSPHATHRCQVTWREDRERLQRRSAEATGVGAAAEFHRAEAEKSRTQAGATIFAQPSSARSREAVPETEKEAERQAVGAGKQADAATQPRPPFYKRKQRLCL
jgi:hypothetical protein